eukprot:g58200.t1
MGELIDSVVGGKVDPWTNEDVPDFPLDTSGPGQAFPRGSVDLSFPQVFMVGQDGPSSSGMPSPPRGSVDNIYPQPSHYSQDGPNLSRTLPLNCLLSVYGAGVQVQGAGCVGGGVCRCREQGVHGEGVQVQGAGCVGGGVCRCRGRVCTGKECRCKGQGVYGAGRLQVRVQGQGVYGAERAGAEGGVRRCGLQEQSVTGVPIGSTTLQKPQQFITMDQDGPGVSSSSGSTTSTAAPSAVAAVAGGRIAGAQSLPTGKRPAQEPTYAAVAAGRGCAEARPRGVSAAPVAAGLPPATTMAAGPRGLINYYKNNCWANALIQCILAVLICAPLESKDPLMQLLRLLYNRAPSYEVNKWHKRWLNELKEMGLDPSRQQDPHEALIKIPERTVRPLMGGFKVVSRTTCVNMRCQRSDINEESICPAVVSMAITPQETNTTSLKACIQSHLEENVSLTCCADGCKSREASKKTVITADPGQSSICIFQLKRYIHHIVADGRTVSDKDVAMVEIPQQIDFCGVRYEICAKLIHNGVSVNSGHYTAQVRDTEGRWFLANDDIVTQSDADCSGGEVYLVFGRLVRQPPRALQDTCVNAKNQEQKASATADQQLHENDMKCHCDRGPTPGKVGSGHKDQGEPFLRCDGCGFFLLQKDLLLAFRNPCLCPEPR